MHRKLLWLIPVFAIVSPVAGYFGFRAYVLFSSPHLEVYTERMQPVQPNLILDRNEKTVSELFSVRTGSLTFDQIPVTLHDKLVFTEDQSFYDHGPIHWPSLFRAALLNFTLARYSQGGSTITQQLARILLDRREKTIFRKLKEAALAYHLEDNYSKQEIITAYMNLVYLGHGTQGMETAASFYFRKSIKDLNFAEELALVSLPSAPERYSPLKNPALLEKKMDAVYSRMQEEGFADISPSRYEALKEASIRNINRSPNESVFGTRTDYAPYVTEYIRLKLRELFGESAEFSAGLRIYTTLDLRLQKAAASETVKHIRENEKRFRPVMMQQGKVIRETGDAADLRTFYETAGMGLVLFGYPDSVSEKPVLQSASVGMNPQTGEVLFMQGGTEFSARNQLNRAVAMKRQTGSSIKPFIYAAGIDSGIITAADILDDTPLFFEQSKRSANDPGYWMPGNITGVYEGRVSVRRALTQSKNVPAIRLGQALGMERLEQYFRLFFFPDDAKFASRFRQDFTIAIGSLEMTPLEMAVAFSSFANNGVIRRPYLIKKITDASGNVLYNGEGADEFGLNIPPERQVITGDVAAVMADLLSDSGDVGNARASGLVKGPLIGKTGTTNEHKDTWFVGSVPGITAVVWAGYDDPLYSTGSGTGAGLAGPLWGKIIGNGAETGEGEFQFSPSYVNITVCKDSGKLPRATCPRRITEVFTHSHSPDELCDEHDPSSAPEVRRFGISRDSDFQ